MCVGGGGSKAKALQACLLLLRDGMVRARSNNISDQKKIAYLRKQVELNQVGIEYY